jgi:hypothetical protein
MIENNLTLFKTFKYYSQVPSIARAASFVLALTQRLGNLSKWRRKLGTFQNKSFLKKIENGKLQPVLQLGPVKPLGHKQLNPPSYAKLAWQMVLIGHGLLLQPF